MGKVERREKMTSSTVKAFASVEGRKSLRMPNLPKSPIEEINGVTTSKALVSNCSAVPIRFKAS